MSLRQKFTFAVSSPDEFLVHRTRRVISSRGTLRSPDGVGYVMCLHLFGVRRWSASVGKGHNSQIIGRHASYFSAGPHITETCVLASRFTLSHFSSRCVILPMMAHGGLVGGWVRTSWRPSSRVPESNVGLTARFIEWPNEKHEIDHDRRVRWVRREREAALALELLPVTGAHDSIGNLSSSWLSSCRLTWQLCFALYTVR